MRRGNKKNKKEFDNFKVYYVNTRGIKSKLNSIERIASELDPQVMCITETMLDKDEKIKISGYKNFYNGNKSGKGGIIIAVKEKLAEVTVELEQITEEYQSLWIKIDNTKTKINIGCVYAPQEKTRIDILSKMYEHVASRTTKARTDKEKIIITGDFNAKIGDNEKDTSKAGKLLKKMALEQELLILNKLPICEGKWTRILSEKEKSAIDYAMVLQEDEKYISKVKIDEEKEHTPKHTEGNKTIFTDHCAIITEIKIMEANIEQHKASKKTVITERSLESLREATETGILTEIAKENIELDEKYCKWMKELTRLIGSTAETKKLKRGNKTLKAVRKMNMMKRIIRRKKGWTRQMKKEQVNIINTIIENEVRHHEAKLTMKMAKGIQTENKMHSGTFYEFKRLMDRQNKEETPSAMINSKGEEVSTRDEIKEVFEKFYVDLFEHDEATTDIERKAEAITQKVFNDILQEAEKPKIKEKISAETIEKSIKKSKNKGSFDYDGISNKIIKATGKDVTTSLHILFNEINQKNIGPEAWANMIIKSIYKGKKSKKEMNNRRGLFLTSVICKMFERAKLDKQRDKIEESLSPFQNGGVQGRSPIDNKMILNATIDYNNFINSETYVFFADAHKCFDKLDLKTSLIDLYEIVGEHEAKLMYNLNKKARITIKTPVGETNPIEVSEITKQGTLYGPILCDINTDKINKIGSKNISTIGPNIKCEASVYVDDIEQAGSHLNTIEGTARNCGTMEDIRKYTFNSEVDKTAFMIIHPKKQSEKIQELKSKVKRGIIRRTKEYKFVGEWYNEKGNHEKSIKTREDKSFGIIPQIKYYGDPYKVGNMALQVRLEIFMSTVIPTIYHDIEAWSIISKKDIESLGKIQRTVLTSILELPRSTPYLGILSELGIWPVEQLVEYKRILLLRQIITSKDSRFLKTIIEEQLRDTFKGCWSEQTMEICEKYNLGIELIKALSKRKLKNILKSRIAKRLERLIKEEAKTKTKLRFCSDFRREKYTMKGNLNFQTAKNIMKLRLNMLELKNNYKGQSSDVKCDLCGTENDTTEHLFECITIKQKIQNVPSSEIIKTDESEKYEQLGEFLNAVCKLKDIDLSKSVRENLREKQTGDIYTVKNINLVDLKMTLKKFTDGSLSRNKYDHYTVKNVDINGLKITLKKSEPGTVGT